MDRVIFKLQLKQRRCVPHLHIFPTWGPIGNVTLLPLGSIDWFLDRCANFEPLLRKGVRYEVFAQPYDSKVGSELPCMLSEQMITKRGAGANHEVAAA
jgi:hypothetical protein